MKGQSKTDCERRKEREREIDKPRERERERQTDRQRDSNNNNVSDRKALRKGRGIASLLYTLRPI